jgi:hypothetical protein
MISEPQQAATVPTLEEVLGMVGQFGSASLGLVAWEFWLSEEQLSPLWIEATRGGLIQPTGGCPETGEPMYSLTTSPERIPCVPGGNSRTARAHERRGDGSGSFRGSAGSGSGLVWAKARRLPGGRRRLAVTTSGGVPTKRARRFRLVACMS